MDDEGELRMRKTKIQESPNLTQVLGFSPLLRLLQIIPKDPTDTEYQKLCRLVLFPNVPTISFYFHLVLFFFSLSHSCDSWWILHPSYLSRTLVTMNVVNKTSLTPRPPVVHRLEHLTCVREVMVPIPFSNSDLSHARDTTNTTSFLSL